MNVSIQYVAAATKTTTAVRLASSSHVFLENILNNILSANCSLVGIINFPTINGVEN